MSVRRDQRRVFIRLGIQQNERLAIAKRRQCPNIAARLRSALHVKQEPSVGSPDLGEHDAAEKQLGIADAIGGTFDDSTTDNLERTVVRDAVAIRCPGWRLPNSRLVP